MDASRKERSECDSWNNYSRPHSLRSLRLRRHNTARDSPTPNHIISKAAFSCRQSLHCQSLIYRNRFHFQLEYYSRQFHPI